MLPNLIPITTKGVKNNLSSFHRHTNCRGFDLSALTTYWWTERTENVCRLIFGQFIQEAIWLHFQIYTQRQKKREILFLLNWSKIKYVKFMKYILHVKLTVYHTVSFTCNIYFLNSTYFIFNQFKITNFRVSFAVGYIYIWSVSLLNK